MNGWLSSRFTSATTPTATPPVTTASLSLRYWRTMSSLIASAIGRMSSATPPAKPIRCSSETGSRLLAPTTSNSTPVAVALASKASPTRTASSASEITLRMRSAGSRTRGSR